MKRTESKLILVVIILLSLLIGMSINSIINSKVALINEKQIIKEMTEGEYESKLTELNKSHEDYALQVQENKQKIATAITNEKVPTSEDASIDEMITNIGKILQAGTADADATAEDILDGKTAYINGKIVTGTANASAISPELVGTSHIKGIQKDQKTYTSNELEEGKYIVFVMSTVYNDDDGTVYSVYCGSDYTKITFNTDSENNTQQVIYTPTGGTRGEAYWVLLDIKTPTTITINHKGLTGYKSAFHADIVKLT